MPRVRLLVDLNIDGAYLYRGQEADVPADVASSLSRLGRVAIVGRGRPDTPERRRKPRETR